jgi:NADP-dependent 3-hydroxy acid dehydrogenase YdfG
MPSGDLATPFSVVTGASSGIGAATARALARLGHRVLLGARRTDRVEELAREINGEAVRLDVCDPGSVAAMAQLVASHGALNVLVNNAGLGLGLDTIEHSNDEDWMRMWETNVLGLVRVTRALIPALRLGRGHVVNIGSASGFEVSAGQSAYASTKHAVRAITRTLRLELHGEPIRITEIAPGLVESEFSVVRLRGDRQAAAERYQGMTPLRPEDVAECVAFAVTRPPHVDVDEIVIRPTDQANATLISRRESVPG